MTNVIVSTIGATPIVIPPEDLEALKGALRGVACTPTDAGYDEARTIWNAMIDRRPGLVIRCQGAADVMLRRRAGPQARASSSAVRGGGHNIAGSAVCDGGLLIDLSQMRSVRVDPAEQARECRSRAQRSPMSTARRRPSGSPCRPASIRRPASPA